MLQDDETELINFAKLYKLVSMKNTKFLVYRDIPSLLDKHVKGKVTLDYGCGAGLSTMFLKALGMEAEGVDINEHIIQNAIEQDPTGDYKVIKSAEIPSKDENYDLVMMGFVLPFVSTKTEILVILQEIARVLKREGTLIIIAGNVNNYTGNYLSIDTNFEENKELRSGSVVKVRFIESNLTISTYFWADEDYRNGIASAGLTLVDIHEPLGKDSDGYEWKDEWVKSPCTIYIAKKL